MITGSRQRLSRILNDQDMKVSIGSEEIKRVKTTKSLGNNKLIASALRYRKQSELSEEVNHTLVTTHCK